MKRHGIRTLLGALSGTPVDGAGVHGRVLSAAGAPISSARVCASCANCPARSTSTTRCTTSDAAGGFSLRLATSSAYVLSAQAVGFVMGYARAGEPFYPVPSSREYFELRLAQGSENLSGTVIDALGGPIANARIKVIRTAGALTPTVEVLSDQDGKFAASVPEGFASLRAEAEGYAPTTALHAVPSRNLVVALTPESRVRGVVIEAGSGKPVQGVSILAYPERASPTHPETVSDEAGEFEVKGLDPGRYTFVAEGERHRGATERTVEVGLAEQIVNLRIEVDPAELVVGKVEIEQTGAPCTEGRVALGPRGPTSISAGDEEQAADRELTSVAAPIERDGTVKFNGVPPGRYHVSLHCFDHIYASGPAIVEVRDGAEPPLWRVTPGGGLIVHVVDANKRPVTGARVSLEFPEQDGQRGVMGLPCDQQGKAVMPRNLRPGTYRLLPDRMYQAAPLSVEIPRRGGVVEVTLALPGSGELVVAVTTQSGELVDDVRVIATRAAEPTPSALPPPGAVQEPIWAGPAEVNATVLGNGQHRLSPLVPGVYQVEVRDGDNPAQIVARALSLAAGAHQTLETVVDRAGSISGRVVDEQGAPVENAWVRAEQQGGAARDVFADFMNPARGVGMSRVLSDEQGNFHLEQLSTSGLYVLRAEKHHGAVTALKDVREGSSVTLKLPSPGTLGGGVLGENGQPARAFEISASLPELPDSVRTQRVHSTQGRFRLEGVPVGRLQLQVVAPGGALAEQWIDLAPNQVLEGLRLSLRRAGPREPEAVAPEATPDTTKVSAGGA
jgi:hypothetical protein